MARTTGTRSLADLVAQGVLKPNEEIVVNRRSAPRIEAVVTRHGLIEVHGRLFNTPSAAAKEVLNVGSVDGWLRWRVPRLGGKSLAELRDNG